MRQRDAIKVSLQVNCIVDIVLLPVATATVCLSFAQITMLLLGISHALQ